MIFSLRQLEGRLTRTVVVTSSERNAEMGRFVFRDEHGEAWLWSSTPVRYEHHHVQTVAEADQVSFLCPECFGKNNGPVGTHGVMVSFAGRNIPDGAGSRDHTGKPSRWNASGNTIDDLVLTPSIALDVGNRGGCKWHGFVGSNGVPPGHAG